MQYLVVLDIEDRNRAPSGAREDVPAYAAGLITGNSRPERLAPPDQIGRSLRPRCGDHQKQHGPYSGFALEECLAASLGGRAS